ncbi:PREDICTED: carboxypeptidase B-like [Amphimedon queenslandica]|uniref:Peptidase M14 domain-containing protein n=1 Tax=Amphimedon queenslandica TaxID=400682 RepID=A0A1X7VI51_AMPQE|nr:PREDICTED: carboxypeptidase B-like [Amphimedon queenslandica]|eukprot:XP_003384060.1 PREDICTED: carboxypeptidase B-like [Amphimedon queenslandica]
MKRSPLVIAFVFIVLAASVRASYYSRKTSYSRDVVLRCNKDNKAVEKVMELASVDVWGVHSDGLDIKMSRNIARIVLQYLPESCFVLVSNVENHVKEAEEYSFSTEQKMKAWRINNGLDVVLQDIDDVSSTDWHTAYHNYESIIEWYKHLAKSHPSLARYTTIGKTAENRDMIAVHITASKNPGRNKMYMQCLIHAREWISGSVCMYQAHMLVQGYGNDREITDLLNDMEFLIVPIVNPDGYHYTWSHSRLWRKNRAVNSNSECRGVDLNRNFDAGWGQGGRTSVNECGETYHGKKAASELEVQHIKKYFKKNVPIVAAIDFHSYGQLILRPYGYAKRSAQDESTFAKMGNEMARQMTAAYISQRSIDLYPACGIASDWFYSNEVISANKGKRPASFTIELRDKGPYGFLLPKDQIMPTVKEVKNAVIYLAKSVRDAPLENKESSDSDDYNIIMN